MVTPTKADLESFDFLVTERWQAPFFGVDHNRFKMGDRVFEAVENEIDGYRSDLGAVEVRKGGVFFLNPVDVVYLDRTNERAEPSSGYGECDLYRLVSVNDGHVWLEFGTENTDDYYPCFIFHYRPRK